MIPIMKLSGPNVLPRFFCPTCKIQLEDGKVALLGIKQEKWAFCPLCGERIEWDKTAFDAQAELVCSECFRPLIQMQDGIPRASTDYIGTAVCRDCQREYCLSTNCLGCKQGDYPNCRYLYLKQNARGTNDG